MRWLSERYREIQLTVRLVARVLEGLDFDVALGALEDADQVRINRYRHFSDRQRALAATMLVRQTASQMLGCEVAEVRIDRTERGRPYLAGVFGLGDFSVTHEAGWVALAWTPSGCVGVDLTTVGRTSPRVVAYMLSDSERSLVDAIEPIRRVQVAATLWALKEAYLKATGTGLAYGMRQVGFRPEGFGDGVYRLEDSPESPWRFTAWPVGDGMVLAIASDCDYRIRMDAETQYLIKSTRADG